MGDPEWNTGPASELKGRVGQQGRTLAWVTPGETP